MAGLVNGEWVKGDIADSETKSGSFEREDTQFRNWIKPPVESGRYQLFVSYTCPWASRTLIFRKLKGLEEHILLSIAEPAMGEEGWQYDKPQDAGKHLPEVHHHHQLYTATDPDYTGKVSVPVLWDRKEGCIVNNESADIIRILNSAFDDLTGNDLDFYPESLREEIDAWNDLIYPKLNNGVYRAGFAKDQAAYDEAVSEVFEALDRIESHLASHRYLAGAYLTEADWRLFVTLVRFDAAYHGVFKCNIRRIEDYPHLSNYLRELYQWPGVSDTVNLEHIKKGYYSIKAVNPTCIVPMGPELDFERAHDRERLSGKGIYQGTAAAK
ncbi:glutathione S-transferase family protein [Pseudidiomarina sp. 1APP75-27a]|uniref:glutathione S-transferase family protein n=1 Tax=Pseudidiomarina terrestris TaxID=2820060 RepID=UPI002B05E4C7|nr:glutathione S-transferase family protein [Pseudidiomarina sp. 1APP75-27a]MEA3588150.1 glutathione S-transferase family protein [Pseudidiomarina sp. 1APP75-27a]